jgi:hypothetical protein
MLVKSFCCYSREDEAALNEILVFFLILHIDVDRIGGVSNFNRLLQKTKLLSVL